MAIADGLTVESLKKGLRCLRLANTGAGVRVAECSRSLNMPRMTVFRLLETLREIGYLDRGEDNVYRPTLLVRTLSTGYSDDEWLSRIARPAIDQLSADVLWAVGVATPHGLDMMSRVHSNVGNPLCLDRFGPGRLRPMHESSSGHVYLAHLPGPERASLLDCLEDKIPQSRSLFEAHLDMVASEGYALWPAPITRENIVCVPILSGNMPIAVLGLQYIVAGVTLDKLKNHLIPALRDTADRISRELEPSMDLAQPYRLAS